jgi:hypothetical protein
MVVSMALQSLRHQVYHLTALTDIASAIMASISERAFHNLSLCESTSGQHIAYQAVAD